MPDGFANHGDAEESEHDWWDGGDEFDVGFDETFLQGESDFADIDGRGNSKGYRHRKRHDRYQKGADE